MSADSGPGRREVAQRLFAVEFDAADYEYAESDEERAPKYVVTPTGARVNRLFAVGVLTEVEPVNDDVLRARVVDQTGAFVVYAGQYQPDAKTFLERAEVPSFVAVTGKANTFQPEGSDRVFTSVRPESLSEVDAETRDRWTVDAAEHTLRRIAVMAVALESGKRGRVLRRSLEAAAVDADLAAGVPLAIEEYGTTPGYLGALRETAIAAAEVVAGERDEVASLELAPDDPGAGDVDLADLDAPSLVDIGELPDVAAPGGDSSEPDTSAVETPAPDADAGAPVETAHDGPDEDDETEPVEVDAEPPAAESSEPDAETEPESGTDHATAEAGDDEPTATAGGDNGASDEPLEDFDADEEFELDEEEREQLEATYGTEFTSGAEVDAPGEADIETPEPEDVGEVDASDEIDTVPPESETVDDDQTAAHDETGSDLASEAAPDADVDTGPSADEGEPATDDVATDAETADDEPAEDADGDDELDLESAVLDSMRELADDDGADREAITAAVVDAHGVDPAAVEDAIQEALMNGECYEPTEGQLKPI